MPTESPIERLLVAVDKLDVEAVMSMLAPDATFLVVDGRHAEGIDGVRKLLTEFLGVLRSTAHRITNQWHQNGYWIAEVEATYELQDRLISDLPRAFVLHEGPSGVSAVRVYGAHEQQLSDRERVPAGILVGERWIPPL
jgi:hypothetical protein